MESFKPLIFLSHSARDPLAKKILLRLYHRLGRKFEVLFDKERLRGGDVWKRELHTWLRMCHGAVVVFSEDALDSAWVLKEATFLSMRKDDEGDLFELIPVLLPTVRPERLAEGNFAPLALGEIQMEDGEDVGALVERVLARLDPLAERLKDSTPLQQVESVVATILSELEGKKESRDAMLRAGGKLGAGLRWRSNRTLSEQLARALLDAEVEDMTDVVLDLGQYFKDRRSAVRLLDLLAPLWVDLEAVAELPKLHTRPRKQRAVIVNGLECPFTGKCYIQRARPGGKPWAWANITYPRHEEGRDKEEELARKLRKVEEQLRPQILKWLGLDETLELSDERVRRRLEMRERSEPLFILVSRDFDDELVDRLRDKYESFTFFMLGGERQLDPQGLASKHVLFLRPELKPGRDQEINDIIDYARVSLESAT